MGGRPKAPPPPPPPPPPRDEADVVQTAAMMAQKSALGMLGFKKSFLGGPRGPGGPDWGDDIAGTPIVKQPIAEGGPKPGDDGFVPLTPREVASDNARKTAARKRENMTGISRQTTDFRRDGSY